MLPTTPCCGAPALPCAALRLTPLPVIARARQTPRHAATKTVVISGVVAAGVVAGVAYRRRLKKRLLTEVRVVDGSWWLESSATWRTSLWWLFHGFQRLKLRMAFKSVCGFIVYICFCFLKSKLVLLLGQNCWHQWSSVIISGHHGNC